MNRVFSFLLWPKRFVKTRKVKKRGSITCRRDRATKTRLIRCLLYSLLIIPVLKRWSRARGPYGYLRTWNWPITVREINQPYNKIWKSIRERSFITSQGGVVFQKPQFMEIVPPSINVNEKVYPTFLIRNWKMCPPPLLENALVICDFCRQTF